MVGLYFPKSIFIFHSFIDREHQQVENFDDARISIEIYLSKSSMWDETAGDLNPSSVIYWHCDRGPVMSPLQASISNMPSTRHPRSHGYLRITRLLRKDRYIGRHSSSDISLFLWIQEVLWGRRTPPLTCKTFWPRFMQAFEGYCFLCVQQESRHKCLSFLEPCIIFQYPCLC